MFEHVDDIVSPICDTISNSIGNELILVFGNKYFGKTALTNRVFEKLKFCPNANIIQPSSRDLFSSVDDTLRRCYMLAIVHAYGSTLDPRRKMSFQRAIWGSNILSGLIKSRVMLGINSPLAIYLRKCTIERLRNLFSLIASDKPYAFLINYIDLSSEDVENICMKTSDYPVNIDYVLGIRPSQDSINFVGKILKRFTGKIHVYF